MNAVMVDHDTPQVCLEPMEPFTIGIPNPQQVGRPLGNSTISFESPLAVASTLIGLSSFTLQW